MTGDIRFIIKMLFGGEIAQFVDGKVDEREQCLQTEKTRKKGVDKEGRGML